MKASEVFTSIQTALDGAREDATKFDNGTNAAGTRVRKALQEIKTLCADGRKNVSETINERKEQKAAGKK